MSYDIIYGDTWCGLPILCFKSGSYNSILNRTYEILSYTQQRYSKVLTVQAILHLPNGYDYSDTEVITRFFKSLNAKLNYEYNKKRKNGQHTNAPGLHFIWVREVGHESLSTGKPHYHICLFLNGHAYSSLGQYDNENKTLFSKIVNAWKSALETRLLHCPFVFSPSLVYFIRSEVTLLQRFNPVGNSVFDQCYQSDFKKLFKHLSYFAKVDTKTVKDGTRNFGSSRIPRNHEAMPLQRLPIAPVLGNRCPPPLV